MINQIGRVLLITYYFSFKCTNTLMLLTILHQCVGAVNIRNIRKIFIMVLEVSFFSTNGATTEYTQSDNF